MWILKQNKCSFSGIFQPPKIVLACILYSSAQSQNTAKISWVMLQIEAQNLIQSTANSTNTMLQLYKTMLKYAYTSNTNIWCLRLFAICQTLHPNIICCNHEDHEHHQHHRQHHHSLHHHQYHHHHHHHHQGVQSTDTYYIKPAQKNKPKVSMGTLPKHNSNKAAANSFHFTNPQFFFV